MVDLPSGTVTFLFTDIEGSTALLRQLGDARYRQLHYDHHQVIRSNIRAHKGTEVDAQSEEFFISFPSARSALSCAIAIQRAIFNHNWPDDVTLRIRIGIHTGEPLVGSRYIGIAVHRAARICAVAYGGQILLSQTTASLVEHELPTSLRLRDLGAHRLKDMQQAERIFQVVLPDLPSDFPALRTVGAVPNNLPIPLTSFIGRKREVDEVRKMLERSRLVTLTGPGGCGKTRLALEVAAVLGDQFPDGIWFMELDLISNPDLMTQQASAAIGMLADRGRTTQESVIDHLRHRTALLILDTCEHLLPACVDLVTALLRLTGRTKILTTSREFLAIPGEAVYVVPSLTLPEAADGQSLERLATSEAVHLFVERAKAASLRFSLHLDMAPYIFQIVRQLDGIPLAIELAAAKTKVLSVYEIAKRLNDRFRLLTGGARSALPRQQTLRAAVDWSHDILSDRERALLRRIAVFSGGCELDAVERVCVDGDIQPVGILDLLTALVDKSLVVVDQVRPRTRYRLLDTIREYCEEKLDGFGETDEFRTKHRDWFLTIAQGAEHHPPAADASWLDRIEDDHENLRAALTWSLRRGEAEAALMIALSINRFWEIRGFWTEGRRWFVAARMTGQNVAVELRAKSLIAEGRLALRQGEYPLVESLGQQSLDLAQQLDDPRLIGQAMHLLGGVPYYRDQYEPANRLFEVSLGFARQTTDGDLLASCLLNLGTIALHRGEYERARRLAHESLEAFEHCGEQSGTAFALNLFGVIEADLGNPVSAESYLKKSLKLAQELGDRRSTAASLSHLGRVRCDQGDYAAAQELYTQSLAIRRDLADPRGIVSATTGLGISLGLAGRLIEGQDHIKDSLKRRLDRDDRVGVAECLEGLGRVSSNAHEAIKLLAAAEGIRIEAQSRRSPAEQQIRQTRLDQLRRELAGLEVRGVWEEPTFTYEQALALVRSILAE